MVKGVDESWGVSLRCIWCAGKLQLSLEKPNFICGCRPEGIEELEEGWPKHMKLCPTGVMMVAGEKREAD